MPLTLFIAQHDDIEDEKRDREKAQSNHVDDKPRLLRTSALSRYARLVLRMSGCRAVDPLGHVFVSVRVLDLASQFPELLPPDHEEDDGVLDHGQEDEGQADQRVEAQQGQRVRAGRVVLRVGRDIIYVVETCEYLFFLAKIDARAVNDKKNNRCFDRVSKDRKLIVRN